MTPVPAPCVPQGVSRATDSLELLEALVRSLDEHGASLPPSDLNAALERCRARWTEVITGHLEMACRTGDAGLLPSLAASMDTLAHRFPDHTGSERLERLLLRSVLASDDPDTGLQILDDRDRRPHSPELDLLLQATRLLLRCRRGRGLVESSRPARELDRVLASFSCLPPEMVAELALYRWILAAAGGDRQGESTALKLLSELLEATDRGFGSLARAVLDHEASMSFRGEEGRDLVLEAALRLAEIAGEDGNPGLASTILRDLCSSGWGEHLAAPGLTVGQLLDLSRSIPDPPGDGTVLLLPRESGPGYRLEERVADSLEAARRLRFLARVGLDPQEPEILPQRLHVPAGGRGTFPALEETLRSLAGQEPWSSLRPSVEHQSLIDTATSSHLEVIRIRCTTGDVALDMLAFLVRPVTVGAVFQIGCRPVVMFEDVGNEALLRRVLSGRLPEIPGFEALRDTVLRMALEAGTRVASRNHGGTEMVRDGVSD